MLNEDIDTSVREAFVEVGRPMVPPELLGDFEASSEALIVAAVRDAIRFVAKESSGAVLNMRLFVKARVEIWITNEVEKKIYGRYLEFMRRQEVEPNALRWFVKMKGTTSPLDQFLVVERCGIDVGTKVIVWGFPEPGVVVGFNRNCQLRIRMSDGSTISRNPSNVELEP